MSAQDVTVDALVARLRNPDTELALLDVREEGQFGEGHMLWAVNLPYSRLEAGVRALVPRRAAPVVLVDDGDGVAPRAARRLATLGYTSLHVLAGGVAAWAAAGHPLFHGVYVPGKVLGEWAEARYATPSIDAQQLLRLQAAGRPVRILDPRTEAEHTARHVPGAWSCPNGELLYRQAWRDLPPDSLIVVACGGRTRGIVGAQTLIDADVGHPVAALQDGNHGWQLAGLTLAQGLARRAEAPVGADRREAGRALARRHGVPQIDPARLRAWQADPTRTLYLLDVRDPAAYARGHLPGAVNAPGGQLVQASDRWLGTLRARVVLVDDDGIRAVQSALWLRRLGWEASALHASADALTQGAASQPAADAADAPAAVGAA
ncbi:MAG: rhodanese-like domain-containing protein, partial [Bordetella sp.]|nr:rhodanese-like domain-containing protein [Bordetella sp.]